MLSLLDPQVQILVRALSSYKAVQHGQIGKKKKKKLDANVLVCFQSEEITIILFKIFSKLSVMNIYYFILVQFKKKILKPSVRNGV